MRIRAIIAWLVALALVASWSADVSAQPPDRQVDAAPRIVKTQDRGSYEQYALEMTVGGETVAGFLLRPKGPGPFPALIGNHGGLGSAEQFLQFVGSAFARKGFVVICCDLGHKGRQREKWKNPGGSDENARRALKLLAFLKELDYVDANRLAMYGHSMGGFCTLATLGRDEAKSIAVAAVSGCGAPVEDSDNPRAGRMRSIAPSPQRLKNIAAPLIIFQGDQDRVVPVEFARNLEKLLKEQGKTVQLHVYAGEGHGVVNTRKRDFLDKMFKFFEKHFRPPAQQQPKGQATSNARPAADSSAGPGDPRRTAGHQRRERPEITVNEPLSAASRLLDRIWS